MAALLLPFVGVLESLPEGRWRFLTKLFCTEKKHFEEDLEVPEGPLLTTDLELAYAAIHAEETELRLAVSPEQQHSNAIEGRSWWWDRLWSSQRDCHASSVSDTEIRLGGRWGHNGNQVLPLPSKKNNRSQSNLLYCHVYTLRSSLSSSWVLVMWLEYFPPLNGGGHFRYGKGSCPRTSTSERPKTDFSTEV